MIYFDHNATTPIDPRVVEAMLPYWHGLYGNPSSLYRMGRIARSAIDSAREQVAALVDACPSQIIFTSGGTEANAMAMASAANRRLILSAIEHPSVAENAICRQQSYQGIETLPTDASGLVTPANLDRSKLRPGDFVSVMLANNETGAIQDVAGLVATAVEAGAVVHTDAVQALGKIPVSFRGLGVRLMSLSGHKIYGPKGCGALVAGTDWPVRPLQCGGDQELGLRAGTENVAAIVGFGKAAELARLEMEQRVTHLLHLRQLLESRLGEFSGRVIFAEQAPRLPNTVQFAVPGVNGEMLLMQLDQKNIAVSSGSACKAGSDRASPVLTAMGFEAPLARAAIRVSFGKDNTTQQVEQFISVLRTLVNQE